MPVDEASENEDEEKGDGDIDSRSGDGNDELLEGIAGHPGEAGNSADGEEGYIRGADSEGARGEGVSEFMEEDTEKKQKNKRKACESCGPASMLKMDESIECKKEEKGRVDADINACDPAQGIGPLHAGLGYSIIKLRPILAPVGDEVGTHIKTAADFNRVVDFLGNPDAEFTQGAVFLGHIDGEGEFAFEIA